MDRPDYDTMKFAKQQSEAAIELEFFHKDTGESTPLKKGDRIYFITVAGEFPGTVARDWFPPSIGSWASEMTYITLDCKPTYPVELHRALFRAFTVLDHIASI